MKECTRKGLDIANVEAKMKGNFLMCLEHVTTELLRIGKKNWNLGLRRFKRGRGRPKIIWKAWVENDLKNLNLQVEMDNGI